MLFVDEDVICCKGIVEGVDVRSVEKIVLFEDVEHVYYVVEMCWLRSLEVGTWLKLTGLTVVGGCLKMVG